MPPLKVDISKFPFFSSFIATAGADELFTRVSTPSTVAHVSWADQSVMVQIELETTLSVPCVRCLEL
ncbi:MAG: hypothetical protein PHW27_12210, partial [Melioribacteraceae bacterium]|nr:hypothetical protein [Melioribacteraceae bacterium]